MNFLNKNKHLIIYTLFLAATTAFLSICLWLTLQTLVPAVTYTAGVIKAAPDALLLVAFITLCIFILSKILKE